MPSKSDKEIFAQAHDSEGVEEGTSAAGEERKLSVEEEGIIEISFR